MILHLFNEIHSIQSLTISCANVYYQCVLPVLPSTGHMVTTSHCHWEAVVSPAGTYIKAHCCLMLSVPLAERQLTISLKMPWAWRKTAWEVALCAEGSGSINQSMLHL
jgi:hypothetical protein